MLAFDNAKVVGGPPVKIVTTYAPGDRALSLILEGAQCNDLADGDGRYASMSFDISIAIRGAGSETMTIDVRGGDARADEHAFGVVRIQVAGKSATLSADDQTGDLYGRLVVPVNGSSSLTISVLLLANGGKEPGGQSVISVDSLDLAFSSQA